MILTEKEARGKLCHATMTPSPLRREEDLFCPARCFASECMAWRWAVDPRGEPAMKKEGDEYRETGYCGLAGEPESAV
jgi:hypothetical protein